MMKNQQLLKSSIESLKMIQEQLHNDIDSSKRKELQKVIEELEMCESGVTPNQLLFLLGRVITWLPAIERIINCFLEL
jgi:hypothetical protein